MALTPFRLWQATTLATLGAAVAFPPLRMLCALAAAGEAGMLARGIISLRSNFFMPAFCGESRHARRIALTFDDGPDESLTPDVLHLLTRYAMPATFFVIGRRAAASPALMRSIAAAGHTIGCHDLTHSPLANFRTSRKIREEISRANAAISSCIGHSPRLYRPPVGLLNPHYPSALSHLSMHLIGWNRRAGDAGNRRGSAMGRIGNLAQPGAVVLLHDCLPRPQYKPLFLHHLEELLRRIRHLGLEPVTVDCMAGIEAYR